MFWCKSDHLQLPDWLFIFASTARILKIPSLLPNPDLNPVCPLLISLLKMASFLSMRILSNSLSCEIKSSLQAVHHYMYQRNDCNKYRQIYLFYRLSKRIWQSIPPKDHGISKLYKRWTRRALGLFKTCTGSRKQWCISRLKTLKNSTSKEE